MIKRLSDLTLAAFSLLVLALPMLSIVVLLRCKVGSPVLFRQVRPGLHGKPFEMLKFRTMTSERGLDGQLLPDILRLTPFGRFLRDTSLDELPGLFNVLKGDMSLVGPRPLLTEYLPLYTPEQSRRHEVRPGLTGWAQVNGRNSISWEDKFKLDVWYVDHKSLWLDTKILWLTVKKVLERDGISAEGEATMPKFKGKQLKKLAVLGASGHGKVVADTALRIGWDEIFFFDDAWPQKTVVGSWQVIGDSDLLLDKAAEFDGAIVAIGDSQTRVKKFVELKNAGFNLVALIHPNAVVSQTSTVGRGTVVFAGGIVNIDAKLGECVIVNTGATVDHDCVLENGVHISPGAHLSGDVQVDAGTWVGVGACVKQGIRIGAKVTVGAGAVVVSDIADGLTVVGNPARSI